MAKKTKTKTPPRCPKTGIFLKHKTKRKAKK